ncbi:MAG: extracellular solute-binding protein, partial [Thermomicrobiales bacterium]
MSEVFRTSLKRSTSRRALVGGAAVSAATFPLLKFGAAAAQTPAAAGEEELEIFSWWTTPGEAAGLQQLFDNFSAGSPAVEVINAAVAGAAGTNAQVALQTRLSANQPPDSWQSHTGAELKARYVDPGYTESMTSLYTEQGWNEVFPQGVIDQITIDGEQYLVPVGVHRGNVMFYNKQVLADNAIEVSDEWTIEDYFAAADTLQAAGIPSYGLGSNGIFAVVQLFENTLLGALGPDDYIKIWSGEIGWDDARVTAAIESLARFFDSVNADHPALTWDGAADQIYA